MSTLKVNRIGLEPPAYKGGKTTLCAGCGHNSISERIIDACYEMGVEASQVIKLSGIGCSSKSPAYFLSSSHGFNAVHGRMPSVATGAMLANKKLIAIGISGDGDTGAIGIEIVEPEESEAAEFDPVWPLRVSEADLESGIVRERLDRRDEIQLRRQFFRALAKLFRRASAFKSPGGGGLWLAPQWWFIEGLGREDSEGSEDTVAPPLVGVSEVRTGRVW